MIAFELVKDCATKEPDAALAASIVTEAEGAVLILLTTVRALMPSAFRRRSPHRTPF